MITVPESVLAYFSQSAVRTSVDLLLSGKEPKVPIDLQWDEVPSFYRACLAARQVQAEFAIFTEQLWREVWDDVPQEWRPCAPGRPDRPDLAVGLSTIWNEGCFGRRFEKGGFAVETSVGLWANTGFQLGLLLYDRKERVVLREDELDGWSSEGCDTFWTQEQITPLTASISIGPFRKWAAQAWGAVSSSIGNL